MPVRRTAVHLTLAALLASGLAAPLATTADAATAPVRYKNCTALNKAYKYGVRKSSSTKDRYTSGGKTRTRTSKAYVNAKLYAKNTHLDRDKDGIACEK